MAGNGVRDSVGKLGHFVDGLSGMMSGIAINLTWWWWWWSPISSGEKEKKKPRGS
jgi:hypothetical protein